MHRTLVSIGPEHLVSGSSEDAGVGLRPDAGVLRPIMMKLTRPVIARTLLEVTGHWGPVSGHGTMLRPVIT